MIDEFPVPIVGFAAYSGTGKTTLLVNLLPIFVEREIRVGVIKHAHHTFDIDYPGKDSYELRKAGARQMMIGSENRWALMVETNVNESNTLNDHIHRMDLNDLDLILVEGFKPEVIPKIELVRPSLGKPLFYPEDKSIIAIATDDDLPVDTSLPVFDLNSPKIIAEFIIDNFIKNKFQKIANSKDN